MTHPTPIRTILLVLPAADHVRVTEASREVPDRSMLRFSILPLTTVAALTPARFRVILCDENVEALDDQAEVDLVGISFMTATAPRAYEIAATFRRRGIPVVAGGYHPTLCTDEVLGHFDAVVVGDAEEAWPRLLADAEAGRLASRYRAEPEEDRFRTPPSRRELMQPNARFYATTAAVQTSRGCRHRCRYCSIAAFHQGRYRTRPVAEVVQEVRRLPRNFIFVDDNMVADPDYARRLFRALIPLRKRWVSQCSLTIADDPELLALARQAGCRGLFVGIETTDQANLVDLDKGFNDRKTYRKRIRRIRRAGIGIVAGMMVGLDRDGRDVFRRTLRFLQRAGIECLQLNILTPLPGTPLFEEMDRNGRILDRDWSRYDFRHCVIQPARMSPRELQDGADWLYRQFYRLDRVILRCLRTLVVAGPVPALLSARLARTYRYDNRREQIRGRDPARRRMRFGLVPVRS